MLTVCICVEVSTETARVDGARLSLDCDEPRALVVPAQAERAVLEVIEATNALDDQI